MIAHGRRTSLAPSALATSGRELELARLLSSTRSRRTAAASDLAELAANADPGRFLAVARRQRMTLLLEHRMRVSGLGDRLPLPLDDERRRAGLQAMLLRGVGGALMRDLEAAGVPALPLKGVTLSRRLYGDDAVRSGTDVDVLVAPAELPVAEAIVTGMGYRALEDGDGLPRLHRTFVDPHGAMPAVEVHWRVHWYESTFSRRMLQRSAVVAGVRTPEPADELAGALLFYHRDGFLGLRLAADLAALWDRCGAAVPPGAIGALAAQHPELAPALVAAAYVAERLVGLPARRLLGEEFRLDRRTGLATRLANWRMVGDVDQMRAEVTLVDGLCTPPAQLGAFARRAFVLAEPQPGDVPEDGRLATGRWSHPLKMLARFGMAAVHLALRRRR